MKRKLVVYTVLTGSVHELNDPFPQSLGGFDRICFTDDSSLTSTAWDIVVFHSHGLDPEREARRPKLLPHRFIPEYECSLYVDNQVLFKEDPLKIVELYSNFAEFVCFRHPWRNCVYDEAEEVIRLSYDKEDRVREQMDLYEEIGFPRKNGLIAGTMLLRRHNASSLIELSEEWYEHVLRFSRRDQLSFNFVAWRRGYQYATFTGQLTGNDYIVWPGFSNLTRVPQDFDEQVYRWLNPEVSSSDLSPRKHFLVEGRRKGLSYRRPLHELNRIANKYKTDKGNLYFNAHAYADVYEHYLAPLRFQAIKVLEMGLLRHDIQARNVGGPYSEAPSLSMWAEYFPNAEVFGLDIADFSKVPEIPNCRIFRGDMANHTDLETVVQAAGGFFDVIIDDGSHASHHQQRALNVLFHRLTRGGYYFIEDLNYQPPHIEPVGATKTKDLLLAFSQGQKPSCSFIGEATIASMLLEVEFIRFYDSQDRGFGSINQDALAVIKKTEDSTTLDKSAGTGLSAFRPNLLFQRMKRLTGRSPKSFRILHRLVGLSCHHIRKSFLIAFE